MAKQIVYTILILAVIGLVLSNIGAFDSLITALSKAGVNEVGILQMRPNYKTLSG